MEHVYTRMYIVFVTHFLTRADNFPQAVKAAKLSRDKHD